MKIGLILAPILTVCFQLGLNLGSILARRREDYVIEELKRDIEELKRRIKMVEEVLTEYSKDNPSFASLLKKKGIL